MLVYMLIWLKMMWRALADAHAEFKMAEWPIDPRTGRPLGDHGTAEQAIEFALLYYDRDMLGQEREFLKAWQDGSLDEWPLFYEWLAKREAK